MACHGAAQGVQGQAGPQIHQESGGDTYWCQEEAREIKSVLASMRETAAKRIEPPPCSVHNKIFIGKKKPNKIKLKYITQEHITQKTADCKKCFKVFTVFGRMQKDNDLLWTLMS